MYADKFTPLFFLPVYSVVTGC